MDAEVDIAIVGFGPVGQALAAMLRRAGHDVAAFERFNEIYRLPRAVHIDHEIMRLLQAVGLGERLADEMVPLREYRWFGADGAELLTLTPETPAKSGWEPDYLFFQPELERALDGACTDDGVAVHRGWVAEGLVDDDDGATLTVRRHDEDQPGELTPTGEVRTARARWVVGADGANSFVRDAIGIGRRDLGFQERWLVVDVEPDDMASLAHLPTACQWCDPRRPTTHVQSGPRHHRWEFMLLPGESPEDFADPARVWSLLEPWFKPGDGPLTRSAVYEFRSMLAERMREGRVLLVGDAAHLTPPFLGQGLCSGLRDAANVTWKLDLVLRGLASDGLLDTVTEERQPHNEWVIRFAVELGAVVCQLDPEAAAQRDAALRQADGPPPLEFPPLSGGAVRSGTEDDPLAGQLSVQGIVAVDGREGRFDDAVGRGWALIAVAGDPLEHLDPEQRDLLDRLGATIASLDPASPGGVADADGRLTAWLDTHDSHAVLIRPDFYVFGSAATPRELSNLVAEFQTQLCLEDPTQIQGARPMSDGTAVIHPKFHHFNLKTTRLQEMIDFYTVLVGAEVNFQDAVGAWLSNDEANHRIALLAFPGFTDDPEKETRTGLHHTAFEYGGIDDLNASYLRLRDAGIEPDFCLDHGMTFSYYYADPDGNRVELQVDNFGDWAKSTEWMQTSEEFKANPIGQFVDPEKVADDHAEGVDFEEIHAKAMAGGYAPEQAPVEIPEASS